MDHWYTTSNTGTHINESRDLGFCKPVFNQQDVWFQVDSKHCWRGSVTAVPIVTITRRTQGTLTVPSRGWEFNGWSGDGISGKANPLVIS